MRVTDFGQCAFFCFMCLSDYDKPCALERNSNGGFKGEHVETCSSTAKKNFSPLPQRLWLLNLAGQSLTISGSHR